MRAPKSLRLQECGRCKFSCPNRCSRVDMSQLVLTQPWEEVWSGSVSGNSRAETLTPSSDSCTRCKASHSLICETKCAFPLTSFPTNPPPPLSLYLLKSTVQLQCGKSSLASHFSKPSLRACAHLYRHVWRLQKAVDSCSSRRPLASRSRGHPEAPFTCAASEPRL